MSGVKRLFRRAGISISVGQESLLSQSPQVAVACYRDRVDLSSISPYYPVIISGAFTVVVAFIGVVGAFRIRGELVIHKQKQAIDLATARLAFLDAHAKATGATDLADSANRVRKELDAALLYYSWRDAHDQRLLQASKTYNSWSYRLWSAIGWGLALLAMLLFVDIFRGYSKHGVQLANVASLLFLLIAGGYLIDDARIGRYRPEKSIITRV